MKKETIADKAREAGLDPGVVYNRLSRGWTLAKALKTPVRGREKKEALRPEPPIVSANDRGDGMIASAIIIAMVVVIIVAAIVAGV
jgi:hypothetical protein